MDSIDANTPNRSSAKSPAHFTMSTRSDIIYAKLERCREGSKEMKRKLSTTSFDKEEVNTRRLRISILDIDREIELLTQQLLDVQKDERSISSTDFKKGIRKCSKRVVSLGEDLWRENRELREKEEELGLKPSLSINSNTEMAHKFALMTLYKDDLSKKKKSGKVQSELRREAIQV